MASSPTSRSEGRSGPSPIIPGSIAEVTAPWLAEATGFPVSSLRAEQIGVGIGVSSALYRVVLESSGPKCPPSVVVKLPALDPAAVFTSTVIRMYVREVRFFDELAPQSPIRVPERYYGAVDGEGSSFVLVMEDLGDMRVVDQLEGMALPDAERAIAELAAWHATWWGQADALAAQGTTISVGDPIYPAILPMVYGEGWEIVTKQLVLAESIVRVGRRWPEAMPRLLTELSQAPTTLAHGDFRADNILFAPDGSVVLLDFQLIGTASAAYDLAYFVTQSLDPEVAAKSERALFDQWIAGLLAAGVPERDLDRMWDDYRKTALFCLVYPVVASRGMDFDDPRQRALLECMNARTARAIEQLDLADLLD